MEAIIALIGDINGIVWGPAMLALLAETPAGREGRVFLVDGTLLFWFGTRLAKAVAVLADLVAGGESAA